MTYSGIKTFRKKRQEAIGGGEGGDVDLEGVVRNSVVAVTPPGGTLELDGLAGNWFDIEINNSIDTVLISNLKVGAEYKLRIKSNQNTINWTGSGIQWLGTEPTLSDQAGATELFNCVCFDGQTLQCARVGDGAIVESQFVITMDTNVNSNLIGYYSSSPLPFDLNTVTRQSLPFNLSSPAPVVVDSFIQANGAGYYGFGVVDFFATYAFVECSMTIEQDSTGEIILTPTSALGYYDEDLTDPGQLGYISILEIPDPTTIIRATFTAYL